MAEPDSPRPGSAESESRDRAGKLERSSDLASVRVLLAGWTLRWLGISFYVPYLLVYFHTAFRLGFASGGLLIAGIAAIFPPMSLVGGGLTDRLGRRRLIVSSLAVENAGLSLLSLGALLGFLPLMVIGMIVSQVSSGIGVPATIAYVGDSTNPASRPTAIAWVRIGINIGYSGGIAIGGIALLFLTFWQMIALAAATVGAAALVGSLFLRPSAQDAARGSGKLPEPESFARGARGALLAAAHSARDSSRTLQKNPFLLELGVACGLSYLMFQQLNYSISTFGLRNLALSYGLVGVALSANGLVCILLPIHLVRWLSGTTYTRVGAWGAAIIGLGLIAIGVDGVLRLATAPLFLAAVITLSVGECFATLPPYALALNMASETERGMFAGAISLVTGSVTSATAALAGLILSMGLNPLITWAILSLPAVPAIAVFRDIGSKIPIERNRVRGSVS